MAKESRLDVARAAYRKALEACRAKPSEANWNALLEAGRELEKADGSYKRNEPIRVLS